MTRVEEAAATYEIEKPGAKHRVTMDIIAKRYGIRGSQLRAYFANMYRLTPRQLRSNGNGVSKQ